MKKKLGEYKIVKVKSIEHLAKMLFNDHNTKICQCKEVSGDNKNCLIHKP